MKIIKLFFIFLAVESSKSQSWGLRKRARKEQKFLRGEKGDFFIFGEILTNQGIFPIAILIRIRIADKK